LSNYRLNTFEKFQTVKDQVLSILNLLGDFFGKKQCDVATDLRCKLRRVLFFFKEIDRWCSYF